MCLEIQGESSRYGLPDDSAVKKPLAMQEMQVGFLGWEDPLGEEMATHSSILAGIIPGTEKPGKLQSVHEVTKSQTPLSN